MMLIDSRSVDRPRCSALVVMTLLASALRVNGQTGCAGISNDPENGITSTPKFCQEFNDPEPRPPDPAVSTYDLGGGGWGNHELEIYCGPARNPGNPAGCPDKNLTSGTAYIDGRRHLVLRAINTGGAWYSARLKTLRLKSFQYGRIEASMELPDTTNPGLGPSIWSLSNNIETAGWPNCGEADIMEVWPRRHAGQERQLIGRHYIPIRRVDQEFSQTADSPFRPRKPTLRHHTYGVIWSANMQQYYIDDSLRPYCIATPANLPAGDVWPFNALFFLLTNIAVAGDLGGTPDQSTPNPGIMLTDYVRQYIPLAPVPAPVHGTPPPITLKAGASSGNASTFTPRLASGTGFVYFSCSTTAPNARCAISTSDRLNATILNSNANPAETVTATVFTTADGTLQSSDGGARKSTTTAISPSAGTPPGSYTVTVYAFTESNISDGENANADANVSIRLT